MPKTRVKIPKGTEKRTFQEAGSQCSFCDEKEVATLQIHHIDCNPANNAMDNLLVACASCHAKITGGVISEADVRSRKRDIATASRKQKNTHTTPANQVNITDSEFHGDITQNVTNFTTRRAPRMSHPTGSLGADLRKKGYIDYLITQYFEFKKAETSYGVRRPFNHAEIHKTIQREFGHKTFFMPVEFFDRLVQFLHHRINRTVLGRHNRSRGVANYHTAEQHLAKHA